MHRSSSVLFWIYARTNPKLNVLGCKPKQVNKEQLLGAEDR